MTTKQQDHILKVEISFEWKKNSNSLCRFGVLIAGYPIVVKLKP